MDVARFLITATPFGGRIEVNGDDITSHVGAIEVRVAEGQPTTIVLTQIGDGKIEGEGIVHVVDQNGDADIICGFLAGIDPDQLDSDALNDADVSSNLTAALLQTLQRYARGDA